MQAGKHLFCPPDAPEDLLALNHFTHNFYHDLESVIWMALDYALKRADRVVLEMNMSATLRASLQYQLDYHSQVFVEERLGSETRHRLMLGDKEECDMLRSALVHAYGDTSPMSQLVDLVLEMGIAHQEAQMSEIDPDVAVGVPMDEVPHKRLSPSNFHSHIYCTMERVFSEISEYYAETGDSLVMLCEVNLDELAANSEAVVVGNIEAPKENTEVPEEEDTEAPEEGNTEEEETKAPEQEETEAPEQEETVAETVEEAEQTVPPEQDLPSLIGEASTAMKRKAVDAPDDSLEAKKPCSELGRVKQGDPTKTNKRDRSPESKGNVEETAERNVKDERAPSR